MAKTKKRVLTLAIALSFALALSPPVSAMHIAEGFLAPVWALSWGAVCIPFVAAGFWSIKRKAAENKKTLVLLALCGAFAFVLSALKIPSVSGSCSHPTGVGLGAILFGPSAMAVIGVIILLFQATLLAHGGLTTLGANTFSMGIAGPLVSFFVYKLARRLKCNTAVAVFLAAFLGDLVTYCVTSVQLGVAYPDAGSTGASLIKFLGIFAVTQIPLAVCEGLLTVAVFGVLEKYNEKELRELAVI